MTLNSRRAFAPLSAMLISAFLAVAVSTPAQATGFPLIVSATVDSTLNTLTITGQNFGSSPTITVDSLPFPTPSSASSTQIVGSFPSGKPPSSFTPGTYFLTLKFTNQYPAVFLIDIDANGGGAPGARFVDNGDGTVTDNKTGLMWQKETNTCTGEVTCVSNTYLWSSDQVTGTPPDGPLFKTFLATLNGGVYHNPADMLDESSGPGTCFANHCDWRIPTVVELSSIVQVTTCSGTPNPCIDPVFGPTAAGNPNQGYWSSTTLTGTPYAAWTVGFTSGATGPILPQTGKYNTRNPSRAVRVGR
jgi:hypothetical protein